MSLRENGELLRGELISQMVGESRERTELPSIRTMIAKDRRLAVGKYVHLNRFDRLGVAVHHSANSFRRISAEHRLTTMEADSSGDLLNLHQSAINVEDLCDVFLTALSFSAHMTVKHDYLRLL